MCKKTHINYHYSINIILYCYFLHVCLYVCPTLSHICPSIRPSVQPTFLSSPTPAPPHLPSSILLLPTCAFSSPFPTTPPFSHSLSLPIPLPSSPLSLPPSPLPHCPLPFSVSPVPPSFFFSLSPYLPSYFPSFLPSSFQLSLPSSSLVLPLHSSSFALTLFSLSFYLSPLPSFPPPHSPFLLPSPPLPCTRLSAFS